MDNAEAPQHIPPDQVQRDVDRVFKVLLDGGVAIIHLDVAYAVLGRTEESVRRIYSAKGRSFRAQRESSVAWKFMTSCMSSISARKTLSVQSLSNMICRCR
jgi:tRNA A37 threonylcarbamoyladenosine synthetase subunit TsaC/SUA5/YrdC